MKTIPAISDKSSDTEGFVQPSFLLQTPLAEQLYFDYAADMPVIDYHNHLPPAEIAENRRFENMTQLWLQGDHYKWRAMRANGISERRITGDASDPDKFAAWAETMPFTVRNPLFHWSQMELLKPFGVRELLNPSSADRIYDHCNGRLAEFPVQGLLDYFKVRWVCTTDGPLDTLEYHIALDTARPGFMRPGFRPDALLNFSDFKTWNPLRRELEVKSGIRITDLESFTEAMKQRVRYFHEHGSRISDHGFGQMPLSEKSTPVLETIFMDFLNGRELPSENQADALKGIVLLELCRLYHELGWIQQFHVGAIRNTNSRLKQLVGADAGTDSIHDVSHAARMAAFLDVLDKEGKLAQTVIYNLNPADNAVFATMAGNFQDGSVPGKIQWGAAWWFLDQKDGMEEQLKVLSNMGLLSRFIGMLTDSRSFLSFSRHEYFRRILCNLLANDMHLGLIPNDKTFIGELIRDVCYRNAERYFAPAWQK